MASFYFCDQNSFLFFFSYLNFGNPIVDCKTVGFFLKISKEISKAWRVPDFPGLSFDCSRVLEYAKIRTVLQSNPIEVLITKALTCTRKQNPDGF